MYATDSILAAIMTMQVSVFPWHICIIKDGDQIIVDNNFGEENNQITYLDLETASENTKESMPEDEKDLMMLCTEATDISKSFVYNTCRKPYHKFK